MPSLDLPFNMPSGWRLLPVLSVLAQPLWFAGIVAPQEARAGSPTCTISATSISFGNVNVLTGAAVDVTATLSVGCSGGGGNGQRLCISIGSGGTFTGSQRQLAGPDGATLNYDLYRDSARTVAWGSWQTGFNGSGVQLDVPQNTTTNITVYARLLGSQQTAPAGSYTASFTANPYLQYEDKNTASCPTGNKSSSTSTTATATVVATCTISASDLSFGSSGSIATNRDASSQLTPRCNNGLPYAVALDGGVSAASDPTQRKMRKSAEQITYGLYSDAARSLPWGSNVGTNTVAGTGTGNTQTVTVYGRVPPQTTGSPGIYSDNIVVSVVY
jgi:spore coat protein U-like protein